MAFGEHPEVELEGSRRRAQRPVQQHAPEERGQSRDREMAERLFLIHKLDENRWNVTKTAQSVDTPRSNLYKKMEQYDIKRDG